MATNDHSLVFVVQMGSNVCLDNKLTATMRLRTLLLISAILAVSISGGSIWTLGSSLISVKPHPVTLAGIESEPVLLRAAPDELVAGSYLAGRDRGAILLLHGLHSDRRQMLRRAVFLHDQGYAVLLIDLPGQGASTASAVTFGLREAQGVRAGLEELRKRNPGLRIGVIGVSLGAASLVLCHDCGHFDAVVLESMYPTIEEAVADRLRIRLGPLGGPLASLLLWQLPVRLGISSDELRPIDYISKLQAPLLIVAGSEDVHTTLLETKRLFAAAAESKELWIVGGAAHVDLHAFTPTEYERRITAFMAHNLDQRPQYP